MLENKLSKKIKKLERENIRLTSALADYRSMVDKYRTLAECSLAGIYVIQNGRLQYVNPRFVELLGYDREEDLIGRRFWEFVHPEDQALVSDRGSRREAEIVYPDRYTFRAVKKDGDLAWIDLRGVTARYLGGPANIGTVVDITEQKKVEEELKRHHEELEELVRERTTELIRANELLTQEIAERSQVETNLRREKFFSESVIDSLPGGFYIYDEQLRMIQWNKNLEEITGYSPRDIRGKMALEFIAPEHKERVAEAIDEALTSGRATVEASLLSKDGESTPFLFYGMRMILDDKKYLVGLGVDITERTKAEQALSKSEMELRVLSNQLITAQEKERQRLALELHDGLGQGLTAIKVGLEGALKRMRNEVDDEKLAPLENLIPTIQDLVEDIRRISVNLRPSMLDKLGILSTIRWFCREFVKVYPEISLTKKIDASESDVPEHLKIVIYRILQEALNNAAKHSRADSVEVSLIYQHGCLGLIVKDNGRGFDEKQALEKQGAQRGMGLGSMRERAEQSGGEFDLQSLRGRGTRIIAVWPVDRTGING